VGYVINERITVFCCWQKGKIHGIACQHQDDAAGNKTVGAILAADRIIFEKRDEQRDENQFPVLFQDAQSMIEIGGCVGKTYQKQCQQDYGKQGDGVVPDNGRQQLHLTREQPEENGENRKKREQGGGKGQDEAGGYCGIDGCGLEKSLCSADYHESFSLGFA